MLLRSNNTANLPIWQIKYEKYINYKQPYWVMCLWVIWQNKNINNLTINIRKKKMEYFNDIIMQTNRRTLNENKSVAISNPVNGIL